MRHQDVQQKLATVMEARKILKCSRYMVYYLINEGYLSAVQLPAGKRGRWLIFRDSLNLLVERMKEDNWYPSLLKQARRQQKRGRAVTQG